MFSLLESACPLALSTHTPLVLQSKFWFFRRNTPDFRLISLVLFSNVMIYRWFCHRTHRHTRKPAMYLCCRSGESGEIGCNPRLAWLTASPLRFLSGDSPHSMWGAWCVAGLLACPASISAPHSSGESPHSFFMSGVHESLMLQGF